MRCGFSLAFRLKLDPTTVYLKRFVTQNKRLSYPPRFETVYHNSPDSLLLGFYIHLRTADILRTVAGFLGSLSPFVSLCPSCLWLCRLLV